MSLITRSLGRIATGLGLGRERRSVQGESTWWGPPTLAGVEVTPSSALGLTAFYAGVNAIATDVASLPLGVRRRLDGEGSEPYPDHPAHELLHFSPDGETTAFHFRQALMGHTLGWGNGYAEIIPRGDGRPYSLHLLHPSTTQPRLIEGKLRYELGDGRSLPPSRVIHIRGLGFDGIRGYCVVTLHRQALGLATAAEAFGAMFFGAGSNARGFLKHKKRLSEEAEKNLRESWERLYSGLGNAHRVAILEEDMDWVQTSVNPDDAQFLSTRQFQVIEICRMLRLPPSKLADMSQAHLSNVEWSNLDYLTTTLAGWLMAFEVELNLKLFTKAERLKLYVDHDMMALMRGDSAARSKYCQVMRDLGAFSVNDVRRFEHLNPIGPLGDKRLVPAAMTTLERAGIAPAGVASAPKGIAPADPDAPADGPGENDSE